MIRSRYISNVQNTIASLTGEKDVNAWVSPSEIEVAMADSDLPDRLEPKQIKLWRTSLALQRLVNDEKIEEGRRLKIKGSPVVDMDQVAQIYEAEAQDSVGLDADLIEFADGGAVIDEGNGGGIRARTIELGGAAITSTGKYNDSLILGSTAVFRLIQPQAD